MDAIAVDQLPQAVIRSVRESFQGAQIISAEKDNDRNDYAYYFVKIKLAGGTKRVELNENGTVVKAETTGK